MEEVDTIEAPRRYKLKAELKKHNITLADRRHNWYQCNECGQTWSPDIQSGGHNPRGWWKCPNGCNVEGD